MGFNISRGFIFAGLEFRDFLTIAKNAKIKDQLGSIIVHLRRGQDVELIMRRPKLQLDGH